MSGTKPKSGATAPTPGPWVVERGGELRPPNERLITAHLGLNDNGVMMIRSVGRTFGHAAPAECEANARAIAAVPDLIKALEVILAGSPHDCGHDDCAVCIASRLARAALAKAGETE